MEFLAGSELVTSFFPSPCCTFPATGTGSIIQDLWGIPWAPFPGLEVDLSWDSVPLTYCV